MTQTARATRETAISAPSTPRARSRLATAAGITPVSRHQLMKAISSLVHAAAVGQEAREDGYGAGNEDEDEHHQEAAEEVLAQCVEGEVQAEGDEDEQGGDLGDLAEEAFEQRGVLVVVAEPEDVHVPDHEAHHEGRKVGGPAQVLGREVAERYHREDGHARRLVPDAGPRRGGDGVAEEQAGDDPDHAPERELLDELPGRTGEGEAAGLDDPDERQGEHRAGDVVEGRLGDHRLGDLGPELQAVEEGDEDRRVRRRQHGADERATGKATPKTGQTTSATMTRRYEHAGQDEQPEADRGTGDHAQGDADAAVEQDQGDPDVEEELGARPRPRGLETRPSTEGPIRAPAATSTTISGALRASRRAGRGARPRG